jgi:hypothetical protein
MVQLSSITLTLEYRWYMFDSWLGDKMKKSLHVLKIKHVYCTYVSLGGLEVTVLATGLKVRGFEPG